MATIHLRIDSILEGDSPSQYFGQSGQFISSTAIDPDFPINSSVIKPSGFIMPIGYAKFSTLIDAPVASIINTPKDTKTWLILTNGKVITFDAVLGSETLFDTCAGNVASSGTYYNNYIYIFGTGAAVDDVSRIGPIDNSPTLANGFWKGTLGKAALSNTSYPSLRGVSLPNHWGFVHGDNALYFTDFESKTGGSYPGQGLLHKIHTTKTTAEGDTDDVTVPSQYGALRLPFGFYPTTLVNTSTNIMVIGIYSTDAVVEQGKAAFVVWDPTDVTSFFLGPVPLADSLATAALNNGGTIYVWTGSAAGGVRVSEYIGGQSTREICLQSDSMPPLAGAVETMGNRICWGGFSTNPDDVGCVWSWGSKDKRLPSGLHNIMRISSSATTPFVTAIKKVQQDSYKQQKLVVGWSANSTYGLDKYSASAVLGSKIRFLFNLGQAFTIERVRTPFAGAMAVNTTIQPAIYFDDLSSSPSLTMKTLNNANYPSKRKALYKSSQLKGYAGQNNFVLELAFTGTNSLGIALPILIDVDVKSDEK